MSQKMLSIGQIGKAARMSNVNDNHIFQEIEAIRLKIEHFENQRRNTFNLLERDKLTLNIKQCKEAIDTYLDHYNVLKKTASQT